jgi:hypothetical protein
VLTHLDLLLLILSFESGGMLPQENLEICPYSKGLFGSTSKPNWVSGDQLISAEIFLLVIALANDALPLVCGAQKSEYL